MGIIRRRSAGITVTMMRSFAAIATVASIAALSSASTLTEMNVKMADCSDCGMGSLGALSVKVCGQAPVSSPGGQCCVAVNLDNSENNFQDGGLDTFRGGELVECQNFDLGGLTGVTDPVDMVIYHSGSDGGQFEYVEVLDSSNYKYRCYFDGFLDGESFLDNSGCSPAVYTTSSAAAAIAS